jgi:hypothetical protein
MELGKSFTYIFQDKRWPTKLLLGWLVSIVPILNFAFTGYIPQTIRNVEGKMEEPLPEWDDFGKKFVLGFFLWVAGIIYSIPIIIVASLSIIPLALAGNSSSDVVGALVAGTGVVVACLIIIYGLLLSLLLPALNINLARKGTFGSVFQIGEFFRIFRSHTGDYLVAWIMTLVWSIAIGVVGGLLIAFLMIIPCIGWILGFIVGGLITIIPMLVYAHLFGQVAAKDIAVA